MSTANGASKIPVQRGGRFQYNQAGKANLQQVRFKQPGYFLPGAEGFLMKDDDMQDLSEWYAQLATNLTGIVLSHFQRKRKPLVQCVLINCYCCLYCF